MAISKVAYIATVYRHLEAFHLPFMKLLQNKGFVVHAYAAPDYSKEGVKNKVSYAMTFLSKEVLFIPRMSGPLKCSTTVSKMNDFVLYTFTPQWPAYSEGLQLKWLVFHV